MHASEWTRLVLSLLIGTVCAFVAFESLEQTKHSKRSALWTGLGGLTLGAGIWSTHFFSMLGWHTAFRLYYDLRLVLVSAAVAGIASWASLSLSSNRSLGKRFTIPAAALTFTAGVAAMHLTGMAALHLVPLVRWDPEWIAVAVLVAISGACCGIHLLDISHNRKAGLTLRLLGAVAFGCAITGMHFFSMQAMMLGPAMQSMAAAHTVDGHVLSRLGLSNVLFFTFGLLVLSYRQSSRWMQMAHDARHEAQEAGRQAERLASAGKIAASIAHEINNPLEAVVNLLYLIETGPLEDNSRFYLKQAQSEIGRIAAITTHTLKFYRQQSAAEFTDIPDLFQTALTLFSPRLQRAGIEVQCSWHPEAGPILCKAGEMRQVLANLVSNAVDAMTQGGVLTLCTRQVGSEIEIEVGDSGAGISPEVQNQIFEPFFTTKGDGGTGLGLSISAEIVARHEGRLTLLSSTESGSSGTRFIISLPASQEQKTFLSVPETKSFALSDPLGTLLGQRG